MDFWIGLGLAGGSVLFLCWAIWGKRTGPRGHGTGSGLDALRPAPEVMHWSPGPEGYPLCQATRRERWTLEFEFATCPECRQRGQYVVLQHEVNTR